MRTAKEFLARMASMFHQSDVIQDALDEALRYPPPPPPDPNITPITIKGLFADTPKGKQQLRHYNPDAPRPDNDSD